MGQVIPFPLHRVREPQLPSDNRETLRLKIMLDWWVRERAMLGKVPKAKRDQRWSEDFAEAVEKVDRIAAKMQAAQLARRKPA